MESKFASVINVDFTPYERIIAISDIHGDCDGFEGVLKKAVFSDKDALVIVGDILEKGNQSLALLKKVMKRAEKGNVYMVLGNNDTAFSNLYGEDFSDEDICWYMNADKKSVLNEMAAELHMPYASGADVAKLKAAIRKEYGKEYTFLQKLPHIIDSDVATFVHAGIEPGDLYSQKIQFCLAAKAFSKQTHHFDKPLIIGHWPATNYCDAIIDANVYVNKETNVYSIDGGNSMKEWQQINYLILRNDGSMESGYYDALPRIRVLDDQKETAQPVTLTFPNTRLEIREQFEDRSNCYVPCLNRDMLVKNEFIYSYGGNCYCWDFTTYHLPVTAGEIVSYCGDCEDGILIKRDGIVGKYLGRYDFLEGK